MDYTPNLCSTLLEVGDDSDHGSFDHRYRNYSLKTGVIVKEYPTNDLDNLSKHKIEYDVEVTEQNAEKGSAAVTYPHCTTIDSFGSIADFFDIKRRVAEKPKEYKNTLDGEAQNGAFVLLLCEHGNSEKAIIIGGVPHPRRKQLGEKDHLDAEVNGIAMNINEDGELTITFKSKTDNEGKPQDDSAGGAFYKMEKDGSVSVSTGNGETVRLDKTGKNVDVTAGADITAIAEKNIKLTATENIELTSTKDLIAMASGNLNLETAAAFNLTVGTNGQIKAPNMRMQIDNSLQVQASMIQLNAPLVAVGPAPAPAVIFTTVVLATGNLGAPTVGVMIGPFSSSVTISP